MYCPKCGSAIDDDVIHCPNCGARIENAGNFQPVQQVQMGPSSGGPSTLSGITCPRCNSTGPFVEVYKTGWQICFCCFGVIPALIYYALAHGKIKCLNCNNKF